MNVFFFFLFIIVDLSDCFVTKANFYEMPGDIGYSQLQIRDNLKTKKKLLAWMTGGGVLTYELDLMSLAKFSTSQSNDNFKRLISEPNQYIIRLVI